MNMKVSLLEHEVISELRRNTEHAKHCGAFTEEQQNDEMLMMRAAIQRLADGTWPRCPDNQESLQNYRNF